jgi:hypothetical protein
VIVLVSESGSRGGYLWDYRSRAAAIGDGALLLVATTRDSPDEDVARHKEMERAVREATSLTESRPRMVDLRCAGRWRAAGAQRILPLHQ